MSIIIFHLDTRYWKYFQLTVYKLLNFMSIADGSLSKFLSPRKPLLIASKPAYILFPQGFKKAVEHIHIFFCHRRHQSIVLFSTQNLSVTIVGAERITLGPRCFWYQASRAPEPRRRDWLATYIASRKYSFTDQVSSSTDRKCFGNTFYPTTWIDMGLHDVMVLWLQVLVGGGSTGLFKQ